jgi:DNA-binding NarL/FixJ family response regulator
MDIPLPTFTQSNHLRPHLLLVDDSPQVLHDLRLMLELPGEVEIVGEASNGQEAVRLVVDLTPDVVVMDLEMPVMNGYEATRRIKSALPEVRVIILSVHAGREQQEKARAAGADSFVAKGTSYDVLRYAILRTRKGE